MRYLILCIFVLLSACDSPTASLPRPPGAVEIEPPPRWVEWYAEMEECAGTQGDFSDVRWHIVPDKWSWESTANGEYVFGEWWPPHDIYIAESRIGHESEEYAIEHESLHDIEQDRGHPEPPFGRCSPTSYRPR